VAGQVERLARRDAQRLDLRQESVGLARMRAGM
jgi:hypothetical protein